MPETIKERVLALRDAQRPDIKSIRKLETTIGISNGALSSWDKSTPTAKNVQKVADFFNVTTDYILGETDTNGPKVNLDSMTPLELDKALSDEGIVMFDGQPLSEEYKRALLAMLRANRGK